MYAPGFAQITDTAMADCLLAGVADMLLLCDRCG
jgi:hypothetical protein